jgi:hypothetical protein
MRSLAIGLLIGAAVTFANAPIARAQTADETVLFMVAGYTPAEAKGKFAVRQLTECRYELQNLSTNRKWEIHFDKMSEYKAGSVAGIPLISIKGDGVFSMTARRTIRGCHPLEIPWTLPA